ncbi:MAG TPA: thioredoxin domain-containing protein [Patescibacteria group bacterium]|nr:thioredoxin domain-containing protein [Patescibacteria group bacterium]
MAEAELSKKEKRLKKREEKESHQKRRQTYSSLFQIGVVFFLFVGVGAVIWAISVTSSSKQGVQLGASIQQGDRMKGNPEAKVELVEYSDFQCPACATYHPIINEIIEKNNEVLKFSYRHLPLQQHKYARLSAYAAEAAGKQGKFWEMYDLLFQNQDVWAESENGQDIFISYAKDLQLNVDQFTQDLSSEDIKDKVQKDYESSVRLGVDHTPTFYLNGKEIAPKNIAGFQREIDTALKEVQAKGSQ